MDDSIFILCLATIILIGMPIAFGIMVYFITKEK